MAQPVTITDPANANAAKVNSSGQLLVSTAGSSGSTGSDGSTAITSGGTAQNLFGGATPANGFSVANPDSTNDLWISLSTTALANGQGSIRVSANGGYYETPPGMKPFHAISIVGAVTGQKITAEQW